MLSHTVITLGGVIPVYSISSFTSGACDMGLFLSAYRNRLDRKGRLSVPAPFRAALGEGAAGVVMFKSLQHDALEACAISHLERLSDSLDQQKLSPETYELVEATIFGGSQWLTFDGEGRISLPENLRHFAGLADEVVFVGRRQTFQLWNPSRFEAIETTMREKAKARDISLSQIIAGVRGGT
ncbi:MAG: hypothetical protein EBZ69_07040 [Alphaproteobacteria bacterium]|nr:hypothetical protein [Alphaproteobacteria bacterium]NDC56548.1 hypothetical protein [Alphaproteobacteria bacterium]